MSKIPELALTEKESRTLATGIANVAQYYPVAIDPKTQAWLALTMTAGAIYGSRIVAYGARLKSEKRERHETGEVHPFPVQR